MKLTLVHGRLHEQDYQHENKSLRLYNNYTAVPPYLGFYFPWFQLPSQPWLKSITWNIPEINNSQV